jgi:hypothetical protein
MPYSRLRVHECVWFVRRNMWEPKRGRPLTLRERREVVAELERTLTESLTKDEREGR